MPSAFAYTAIGLVWLLFYWKVIVKPYSFASSEQLDCDFPTFRLCGEYWRKLQIPQDPYYFKDLIGSRSGTLYPINIIFSWLSSFCGINFAWRVYTWNILLHSLLTTVFAYQLFGCYHNNLIALFGALAWGFAAYHMRFTLWYVETFTWITATLWLFDAGQYWWSGVAFGMLLLSGHPPFVLYFTYCFVGLTILRGVFPLQTFSTALVIGSYQWYRYHKHNALSIRSLYTVGEKTKVGKAPLWIYLFTAIPYPFKSFIDGVEYTDFSYYVTPLIVILAFYSQGHCWILLITAIILSRGGKIFKLFGKLMTRFPCRWGYFAVLALIILGVNGLYNLKLTTTELIVANILLILWLLPNRSLLLNYPFNQWTRKPSEYFETPLLKYLEAYSRGYVVNNLPYPVYSGQINHITTFGYTGGNHSIHLHHTLKTPLSGVAPYNYFDYNKDSAKVEKLRIKFHIGDRPSNHPKWVLSKQFNNLWINTSI